MPYPLDSSGNIRVDFVWGNVPMQPDEQRTDASAPWNDDYNQPQDRGWTSPSRGFTSDTLGTTATQYLSLGDKSNLNDSWDDVSTRSVVVPTIHDIATTGYNNFPAFRPNYAGDGDAGLESIMPNLVGLGSDDFVAALQAAGFSGATGTTARYTGSTVANNGKVYSQTPAAGANVAIETQPELVRYVRPQVPSVIDFDTVANAEIALEDVGLVLGTSTTSTVGATAENDGWVKSQSIAPGTTVNGGTAVNLVAYDYVVVAPATTGPFQRMGYDAGSDRYYFFPSTPADVVPVGYIGSTFTIANFVAAPVANGNYVVDDIVADDAYNTGGQKVWLQKGGFTWSGIYTSAAATWTVVA